MSHVLSLAAAFAHGDEAAEQRAVEAELGGERFRWRDAFIEAGVPARCV